MSASEDISAGTRKSAASRGSGFADIAAESSQIIEDARELGHRAVSTAGDAVTELRDHGNKAIQRGKKKVVGYKDDFEGWVSENPTKAVLIAAGAGAVLGLWLARRR